MGDDLAEYYSTTNGGWVPAVVVRFNEENSTYVLDIQPVAAVHKVRARKNRPSLSAPQEQAAPESPPTCKVEKSPHHGNVRNSLEAALSTAAEEGEEDEEEESLVGVAKLHNKIVHERQEATS